MVPRTFLVLSDIHFGAMAEHPDFSLRGSKKRGLSNPEPLISGMVTRILAKGIHVDGIIVPGDLTSTAEPAEFSQCFAALIKIGEALGVSPEQIFVTFGNHDTNWKISKLSGGLEKPRDAADSACGDEQGKDPLYKEIAAQIGPILSPNFRPPVPGPTPGSGLFSGQDFDF